MSSVIGICVTMFLRHLTKAQLSQQNSLTVSILITVTHDVQPILMCYMLSGAYVPKIIEALQCSFKFINIYMQFLFITSHYTQCSSQILANYIMIYKVMFHVPKR